MPELPSPTYNQYWRWNSFYLSLILVIEPYKIYAITCKWCCLKFALSISNSQMQAINIRIVVFSRFRIAFLLGTYYAMTSVDSYSSLPEVFISRLASSKAFHASPLHSSTTIHGQVSVREGRYYLEASAKGSVLKRLSPSAILVCVVGLLKTEQLLWMYVNWVQPAFV